MNLHFALVLSFSLTLYFESPISKYCTFPTTSIRKQVSGGCRVKVGQRKCGKVKGDEMDKNLERRNKRKGDNRENTKETKRYKEEKKIEFLFTKN